MQGHYTMEMSQGSMRSVASGSLAPNEYKVQLVMSRGESRDGRFG